MCTFHAFQYLICAFQIFVGWDLGPVHTERLRQIWVQWTNKACSHLALAFAMLLAFAMPHLKLGTTPILALAFAMPQTQTQTLTLGVNGPLGLSPGKVASFTATVIAKAVPLKMGS